MTSLVTGVAGFAGSHLAERLIAEGQRVIGVVMPGESTRRIEHLGAGVDARVADITDPGALRAAVADARPEYVFHLAAVASVPAALAAPEAAFRVNVLGTVNLLEALRESHPKRFVYISSADVYGQVPTNALPVRETRELRPASPYSASKAACEVIVRQYWRTYAVPAVILRPFNHTGPGQGPGFAPSDFAAAVARIEKGLAEPRIAVGNLESYRDFSDVRDMVRAYCLAARLGEAGEEYNVSSGIPVKISDVLGALLGMSKTRIEVVADPARQRPSDTPVVTGDHSKFSRRTGWAPTIPFEKTLADLLEWWRGQI